MKITMNTNPAFSTNFYQFTKYPKSDSGWGLSTGPEGRIYVSVCHECIPGGTVIVARYNETKDDIDYLFDVSEVTGDPVDSGRATQCKIHYSFVPSQDDGILYCATHLSGPPIDLKAYSPWLFWHDKTKCFRGSELIAYDTVKDKVLWHDIIIPKEGCRCLAFDSKHKQLYALSYPRDHFIIYSLETKTRRDLGRIGSINSQVIFLDKHNRAWMTDDYGHMIRYNPDTDILEQSTYVLPHEPYQTGWHSVLYDVVASPDGECVYITTWSPAPRLIRFWPTHGEFGTVEDLGCATQSKRNTAIPFSMFLDHSGGVVFGNDGNLYYGHSRWDDDNNQNSDTNRQFKNATGAVVQLNPQTLERKEVATLTRPDGAAQYISRGARDRNGDLFFMNVGRLPVGFFKMTMPGRKESSNSHLPLRIWG
ncbi:MAG: hypothetical protein WC955_11730 [Elusimicrobiota bacterium]